MGRPAGSKDRKKRVVRVRPLLERVQERLVGLDDPDGCHLWAGDLNTKGYGRISAGRRDARPRKLFVHKVVYESQHGPIPKGMEVCHDCDHRNCANLKHLFLGTHTENMQDMVAKGRHGSQTRPETRPRGAQHHNTKIMEHVPAIRLALRRGVSVWALARRYNVHSNTIVNIKTGKSYKWM